MILNTFKIFSRISLIFILILFFTNYDNLLAKELFPVVDGGHVAYIDTAGNLVIDMELDTPYEEGTIEFEGKEYPTYIFPEWAYFSEGKTTYMMTWGWWFIRFGKNYGVIDTLGKIQLYPYSNIIWPFRNNLAKTSILLKSFDYIYGEKNTFVHYDDLQNLLDKDYYFKYPLFDYCGNFSEGFAVVLTFEYNEEGKKVNEGKFNYLGIDGKLITDKGNTINSKGENLDGFEDIRTFSEGMGVVQIDSLWGAVNSNGELVITPKYPILWEFHDGLARFFDGKFYGFINANGEKIFGQMFREASDFSDGYSKVILQENEYAYISTDGTMLEPKVITGRQKTIGKGFAAAGNFVNKLAPVMFDGKWGYLNTNGDLQINPVYDFATDFRNGFAQVWDDEEMYIINTSGEVIYKYLFY